MLVAAAHQPLRPALLSAVPPAQQLTVLALPSIPTPAAALAQRLLADLSSVVRGAQHQQHQDLHRTQMLVEVPLRHLRLVLLLVALEGVLGLALADQQLTVQVHQFTQVLTVAHTQLLQLAH
tara:strand:+ start:197 stop:562 length:366 start_codon:yes stop_codon:yes gene_type:complete